MGTSQSDLGPGLGANVRTLVAELRGRCAPTFVARDEEDATKLSVVEHLSLDGGGRLTALARVSALSTSPNPRLTRIRGAIERPGGIDLVSDFIDGELLEGVDTTLRESGTPIPTMCALRIISDILAGLHTLHAIPDFATSGHGKLSLRTVMVGLDGRVRLIELVRGRDNSSSDARFIAPEVAAGREATPRADIFAAGAILAALLASGDPAEDVSAIRAVAERAVAPDAGDRFESAAAMLSALASTFRGAPSHADVARLMAASVGDQIRARRAAAEKAPILADTELRQVLAPPLSMPVAFAAEPLPGSRRASSWPSALQGDSLPPSSEPFLGTAPPSAPPSSAPPSARRTDRPPPGFGSAPASGSPLPLGLIPPSPASVPAAAALAPDSAAAPSSVVSATAPTVQQKAVTKSPLTQTQKSPGSAGAITASPPTVRAATPSTSAVRAAPPARASAPSLTAKPASSPTVQAVRATAVMKSPVAAATPPPVAAPPAAPPPAVAPPAVVAPASVTSTAATRPNPEPGPESRPTDSWRYASAKPVAPPPRAITLPVPDESIIVEDTGAANEDRTLRMMSPASVPPSVRHIPSSPPGAATSSKLPAVDLRPPTVARKPPSKLAAMTLVGLAVVGLAAGGLALRARGKSADEGSVAASAPRSTQAPAIVAAVPAAATALPVAEKRCADGTVFIEGGVFTMGSDAPDASAGAKPAHAVKVSPYCIDDVEVSVAKFKACSDHGDCKRGLITNDWAGITPAEHAAYEPLCTLRDPVGMASHPINCVDWERADIYCTAHNGRLPTEAEWELAARGRDNRAYPWGNESPSVTLLNGCGAECTAWAGKNALELTATYDAADGWLGTAPGKTFPGGNTPEGVADLAGNVAEWVADAYAPYSATAQTDPVVTSGELKVVRGGSFLTGKRAALATTYRSREKPTKRSSTIGFRCVSPPGTPVAGR